MFSYFYDNQKIYHSIVYNSFDYKKNIFSQYINTWYVIYNKKYDKYMFKNKIYNNLYEFVYDHYKLSGQLNRYDFDRVMCQCYVLKDGIKYYCNKPI